MSKVKKITTVIIISLILQCIMCVTVFATSYNMPYSFVNPTSTSFYIELVTENWGAVCIQGGTSDNHNVTSSEPEYATDFTFRATVEGDYLYIRPITYKDGEYSPVSNVAIYAYCYTSQYGTTLYSPDNARVRLLLTNCGSIVGIHGYNCDVSDVPHTGSNDFTFVYGNDKNLNDKLDEIIIALRDNANNTTAITSNADKNASEIQANNDKNAQAIIDNQNNLHQQEKTETENSGNDSVSGLTSVIPDNSTGILDALGKLKNSISYTGTDCKWSIPEVYIPKIDGVIDKTILIPANTYYVDFGSFFKKLPPLAVYMVQSLFTIGLVIWAFKELYNIISYVLTLKTDKESGINE